MLLYLKIKPNQRFESVEISEGDWIIKVKAPAIDGKANEYLIAYLSRILDLPKSKIILKKGLTSPHKCLEIDADTELVTQKLVAAIQSSAQ
jgi:uncharacterized protein